MYYSEDTIACHRSEHLVLFCNVPTQGNNKTTILRCAIAHSLLRLLIQYIKHNINHL